MGRGRRHGRFLELELGEDGQVMEKEGGGG